MKRRKPPTEGDGLVYGHHAPAPRLTAAGAGLLALLVAVPSGAAIGVAATVIRWIVGG